MRRLTQILHPLLILTVLVLISEAPVRALARNPSLAHPS